jgi:hypothetical protein
MPARGRYHQEVRHALEKDGWTITDDPLHLRWGGRDLYVDLGAEQLMAAEKGNQRIAVEIKSFLGFSEMADLEDAIGQFVLYEVVLAQVEPDRRLYLAIPAAIFAILFTEPNGQLLIQRGKVRLVVFDPASEEVSKWTG